MAAALTGVLAFAAPPEEDDDAGAVATTAAAVPTQQVLDHLEVFQAVDTTGAPAASTSGCEAEDFADFQAGDVALLQRGTCTFGVKAANAQAAGASAVLIFNTGLPGQEDVVGGTLGEPGVTTLPVVGLSHAAGTALLGGGKVTVTAQLRALRLRR